MLEISRTGDVVEVIERLPSAANTRVTYWYYDVKNWRKSILGNKGEAPTAPMTEGSIAWVRQYYLPRCRVAA